MSNIQFLKIELQSDLMSRFNMALALKNENPNTVLNELISQYIVFAFKSEASKIKCKTDHSYQNLNSNCFHFKSKKNNIGQTDQIRAYITEILNKAKEEGFESFDVQSGDIHREMGLLNRIPSVCAAMESLHNYSDYEVIYDTQSKRSSTRVFRYQLNK
ncbi:MAG: hypothetical protein GT601_17790 [Acidaminobacter sp.]|uniref:hypothetical protein n=1 Tax=Acidaminobacter sp. TaxID=1872102 RepID=UPI001380E599|nr:hypothetical protein [Acidaminobacter sp.]MZQ99523.1 hypothetical protein [Acidaminobacter sp.]